MTDEFKNIIPKNFSDLVESMAWYITDHPVKNVFSKDIDQNLKDLISEHQLRLENHLGQLHADKKWPEIVSLLYDEINTIIKQTIKLPWISMETKQQIIKSLQILRI
jgi:hypothetical protein